MALQIFEMTRNLPNNSSAGALRSVPWNAVQTPVAIGAGSTQSAVFGAQSRAVALIPDVACYVEFGTSPTATTDSWPLAAGEKEDFWLDTIGLKVAVLAV